MTRTVLVLVAGALLGSATLRAQGFPDPVSGSTDDASVMRPPAPVPPEPWQRRTGTITLNGAPSAVDLYLPTAEVPDGAAIIAHGFTRDRTRHRDLARALARAGIVAIVPDLPGIVDLWGNGDAIVELADQLENGALGLAPVQHSRLVLIGTSAGGLATLLAAARLPGLAGWIGLDPVDRTGTAARAAGRMHAPAVVLLGDPSGCNLFGSGRSIAGALAGPVRTERVEGASHCDFESPTNNFCRTLCGGASGEMQARLRDMTVAAVETMIRGERYADPPGAPGAARPEAGRVE